MNLETVYRHIAQRSEPDYLYKKEFGKNAKKFLKAACKLADVIPEGKVYHNEGGPAVWGDVYCNIKHPTKNRVLEICFSESGPFYRTNGEGGYGQNCWIMYLGVVANQYIFLDKYTEDLLANVIMSFLENTNPRLF